MELCDVNPRVINVTVPRRMRRVGPSYYRVWFNNNLHKFDIDWRKGIRVTSAARSISDALDSRTRGSLIEQAIESAMRYRPMDDRDERNLRNRLDIVYGGRPRTWVRALQLPKQVANAVALPEG
jgi:predicted transcriptional regulator of viral defense system